jgi:hypothetical protein
VEIRDVDWGAVFADTDAAAAREIYSAQFRLEGLRILRVVFAAETPDRVGARAPEPEDDWTTVLVPDVDVWVAWGGRVQRRPPVVYLPPSARDRRDEIGRDNLVDRDRRDRGYERDEEKEPEGGETRSGDKEEDRQPDRRAERRKEGKDSGGIRLPGKKSDDDDDDDEDRLLPGALAGVAAIGALAAFGGTIGYAGSVDKAPIGLMAGRVGRRGGALFHVAVNQQVFGKASGPENLSFGVTGFMDLFRSPIQPSVGVGMRITEEGTETTRTLPSLALGLVANTDYVVFLAAYDVEAGDVRFGVGLNIRAILAAD